MSYKLAISNIDSNHELKATLIGANETGGRFYYVSTFNTKEEAEVWAKLKVKQNNMTMHSLNVESNDGPVIVSGVDESLFEDLGKPPLDKDEEESEPKSKPKKLSRFWYENAWDAFRRMW